MSILVKGVEMPKNCFLCPLSVLNGERLFCEVTKDEVLRAKRSSDCPLIPVPPHGRLGDLDELERDFREDAKSPRSMRAMPMNWADAFEEVADIVADAPTIIPAEETNKEEE